MARHATAPGPATPRRETDRRAADIVAHSRADYAGRLLQLQRQTVENILDMGRVLIEAKAALPHGEFSSMVEEDLGWNVTAAQRLMRIARHEVLAKAATLPLLPPSREVLYLLTQIPTEKLSKLIEDGKVTPALTMTKARQLDIAGRPEGPDIREQLEQLGEALRSKPKGAPPPAAPPETPKDRGLELARQVMEASQELDPEDRPLALRTVVEELDVVGAQIGEPSGRKHCHCGARWGHRNQPVGCKSAVLDHALVTLETVSENLAEMDVAALHRDGIYEWSATLGAILHRLGRFKERLEHSEPPSEQIIEYGGIPFGIPAGRVVESIKNGVPVLRRAVGETADPPKPPNPPSVPRRTKRARQDAPGSTQRDKDDPQGVGVCNSSEESAITGANEILARLFRLPEAKRAKKAKTTRRASAADDKERAFADALAAELGGGVLLKAELSDGRLYRGRRR